MTAPDRDILRRHRVVQVISVLMIVAGILLPAIALASVPDLLTANPTPESVQRHLGPILLLGLGGLLLVVGLVMNAVRSVIVRGALSPERYRGPAIFVLLVIAIIVGSFVALGAGGTAIALFDDSPLSVAGTLVLLTSTQIGLLATTGALVIAPHALAGVRLVGRSGLARSILIGVGMAIPAWIGAQLLGTLAAALLHAMGFTQGRGVAETVIARGDPTVILLAFVLVAPAAEEIFFRGVVYNAWERERGPWVALFGSAALFAVLHTDPDTIVSPDRLGALVWALFAVIPIFALGVALALVYRSTRSLAATIAMHAGFNAISVVIALLDRFGILTLPT